MSIKTLATGSMLVMAGFVLGAVYSNWTYDYYMLWVSPTPSDMLNMTIEHYKNKAMQPQFLHHVLHTVFFIGGISAAVKLIKPTESNTLFDGGSLFLFFICVVFYITNLLPARYSLLTGDWGDIDVETGVKFISASQILMVFAVCGVLALQFGQWWAGDDQTNFQKVPISTEEEKLEELQEETAESSTVKTPSSSRKTSRGI